MILMHKRCRRAIRLILGALVAAVGEPGGRAREKMGLAAHLAGRAIQFTRTTAPHAISPNKSSENYQNFLNLGKEILNGDQELPDVQPAA